MNKIFKRLLLALLLLLSPLASIAILGAAYIAARVINGLELSVAVSSFKTIIYNLNPYFPYLTITPAILLILAQLIKSKIKVSNLRKWKAVLCRMIFAKHIGSIVRLLATYLNTTYLDILISKNTY